MSAKDSRWLQCLNNFSKALARLDESMQLRQLSHLEKQGVIQVYEGSYELARSTSKDFLLWRSVEGVIGARDTIREAFIKGLIEEGVGLDEYVV